MAPCTGRRFSPLWLICFTSLLPVLIMPIAESLGIPKWRGVSALETLSRKRKAEVVDLEGSGKKAKIELKKKKPAASLSEGDTWKMSRKDTGKISVRRVQDVGVTKRQPEELVVWLERQGDSDSAAMTDSGTSTTTTRRRIIQCQATMSKADLSNCLKKQFISDSRFSSVYGVANNRVFLFTLSEVLGRFLRNKPRIQFFLNCVPPTLDERCIMKNRPYVMKYILQAYKFPEKTSDRFSMISLTLGRGKQNYNDVSVEDDRNCAHVSLLAPLGTLLKTGDGKNTLAGCADKSCKLTFSFGDERHPLNNLQPPWLPTLDLEPYVKEDTTETWPFIVDFPEKREVLPQIECWDGQASGESGRNRFFIDLYKENQRGFKVNYYPFISYGVLGNIIRGSPDHNSADRVGSKRAKDNRPSAKVRTEKEKAQTTRELSNNFDYHRHRGGKY